MRIATFIREISLSRFVHGGNLENIRTSPVLPQKAKLKNKNILLVFMKAAEVLK